MAYLLVLLAVAGRLVPHPPNLTPVLATALFAGALLPGRLAPAVPLLAMLASDLALGHPVGWISLVVYGCFVAAVGLGRMPRQAVYAGADGTEPDRALPVLEAAVELLIG